MQVKADPQKQGHITEFF